MRIRLIALASVLLLSHVQAADLPIKLPQAGVSNVASEGKIVQPAPVGAAAAATPAATPAVPVVTAAVPAPGTTATTALPVQDAANDKGGASLKQKIIAHDAAAKKVRKPTARRKGSADDEDERNMQLLAEKISSRLAALRKAKASQPPAPVRKKTAASLVKTSAAAAAGSHAHQHWRYEGEGGPGEWGKLNPAWAACDSGQRQSPIDIRDGIRVDLDPVSFDYQPARFNVLDNGHTVQVNFGAGNTITVTGRSYELTQFHFHLPSEERINGKGFPMVLHLVHKNQAGRLAVVAVLVEEGTAHEVVQQVWNNLPLEKNDPVIATAPMELAKLLPTRRDYYTYMGSLTTPPCSEGVLWIVMKEPIQLSSQQIAIFSRLYPMNARPIQAQSGRMIKESN